MSAQTMTIAPAYAGGVPLSAPQVPTQPPTQAAPQAEAVAEPRPGAIRGAVDNVGAEKIYGWAWYPDRPGERLRIEARLAGKPVISARADFARADLPNHGVGDGNHAFELKLTPECIAKKAELAIYAVSEDGSEAKLTFRVRRTPAIAAAEERQRDLIALATEQRELRAAIVRLVQVPRGADAAGAAAQIAQVQAKLEERLGVLDTWLTRLDTRLAALAEAQQAAPRRRMDPWQVALGVVLALAGGGAFAASVLILGHP